MATWSKPLPGTASEGSTSHVQDHDRITACLVEIRARVDDLAEQVEALSALATDQNAVDE